MAESASGSVLRQVETLFEAGTTAGLTDGELLARFAARRDAASEAAFAALVARHGPMVLNVCRQLLGHRHDAEDAFQAAFLVLARKAATIRTPELLSHWLYGVAIRCAARAKARIGRQRRREENDAMRASTSGTLVELQADQAGERLLLREDLEALHQELARLPGRFQRPLILCYLEGLTTDEAARRLSVPVGTVRSRLARARDRLRRALTRRGLALSAAALAVALEPGPASAMTASPLCEAAATAATRFAAGQVVSTPAAALAHEVIHSMLIRKIGLLALALLAAGAVATTAGVLSHSLAVVPQELEGPGGPAPPAGGPQDAASDGPAPGRMFVVGRVLDPAGRPVPAATTMIYARNKAIEIGVRLERVHPVTIGQAQANAEGRFRIEAPRTSSARNELFGSAAVAPGYGVGWTELDCDDDQPAADIQLRLQQVIQGRLFDLQGQPCQGVQVIVQSMGPVVSAGRDPRREFAAQLHFRPTHASALLAWPKPAMTDATGRFTVHGVGRSLKVTLNVMDPRYAHQSIVVETDAEGGVKEVSFSLRPPLTITGRVTYADTGQPAHRALLSVVSRWKKSSGFPLPLIPYETDAEGRFRTNAQPGDLIQMSVYAPAGEPYLSAAREFDWAPGRVEYSVDFTLNRGITVRGRVTEEGSGRPIAGCYVCFASRSERGNKDRASDAMTGPDGSFMLGAPAGPGHLVVQGPSDGYISLESRSDVLLSGGTSQRRYAHALVPLELKPGDGAHEIDVVLRPGRTVKGRLTAAEGQPIDRTLMLSPALLLQTGMGSIWQNGSQGLARHGRFELHGLAPSTPIPVFFLDPRLRLGATAQISADPPASDLVTVRLEPCGTARLRLVDLHQKPVAGYAGYQSSMLILMVITPGPYPSREQAAKGELRGDLASLPSIDAINYNQAPTSDSQGRMTFPALVPGATYRVYDFTTIREFQGPALRKEFTVNSGETRDLGDIPIANPPG